MIKLALSLLIGLFLGVGIVHSIPSFKSGLHGNLTRIERGSKELEEMIAFMKPVILNSRYMYMNEISEVMKTEYLTTYRFPSSVLDLEGYSLDPVESTKQITYFSTDGNSNMKAQRMYTHPNGQRSMYYVDFPVAVVYDLLLEVKGTAYEETSCKYVKVKIFRDYTSVLSLNEFICYDELPSAIRAKLNDVDEENSQTKYSLGQHSDAIVAGTVKIMSYNLWNYNSPWVKRRFLVIDNIAKDDPDVIAFQELRYSSWEGDGISVKETDRTVLGWKRNQAHHLWTLMCLKNLKYSFTYVPSMVYFSQDVQIEGLGIFTKDVMIDVSYQRLSRDAADHEDEHQRSCLHAEVLVPGQSGTFHPLHVFTSHFSLGAVAKRRNAEDAIDFMKKYPRPHVFLGDLNSEPEEDVITFLTSHMTDTWKEYKSAVKSSSEDYGYTFPTLQGHLIKRIDFIMSSEYEHNDRISLATSNFIIGGQENINGIHASDHALIMTQFDIVTHT